MLEILIIISYNTVVTRFLKENSKDLLPFGVLFLTTMYAIGNSFFLFSVYLYRPGPFLFITSESDMTYMYKGEMAPGSGEQLINN